MKKNLVIFGIGLIIGLIGYSLFVYLTGYSTAISQLNKTGSAWFIPRIGFYSSAAIIIGISAIINHKITKIIVVIMVMFALFNHMQISGTGHIYNPTLITMKWSMMILSIVIMIVDGIIVFTTNKKKIVDKDKKNSVDNNVDNNNN